jgi:ribosomal protein S18 acetylase RimI-like enzyme
MLRRLYNNVTSELDTREESHGISRVRIQTIEITYHSSRGIVELATCLYFTGNHCTIRLQIINNEACIQFTKWHESTIYIYSFEIKEQSRRVSFGQQVVQEIVNCILIDPIII